MLVTFGDEFTIVFAVFHLGLLDSFCVILIFLVGIFFEVSPLTHHAVKLLFKAFALDLVSLLEIDGIREANFQLGDLIISRIKNSSLFLSESFDQPVVPFLSVSILLLEGFFKALNLPQVLCLLELDSISLQICIFDSLLALRGQTLYRLLSLLVHRHFLLLILK